MSNGVPSARHPSQYLAEATTAAGTREEAKYANVERLPKQMLKRIIENQKNTIPGVPPYTIKQKKITTKSRSKIFIEKHKHIHQICLDFIRNIIEKSISNKNGSFANILRSLNKQILKSREKAKGSERVRPRSVSVRFVNAGQSRDD